MTALEMVERHLHNQLVTKLQSVPVDNWQTTAIMFWRRTWREEHLKVDELQARVERLEAEIAKYREESSPCPVHRQGNP